MAMVKKDQIPFGIFVFSIMLNTIFTTLILAKVSLDAWGTAQFAAVTGKGGSAALLWSFWSEFYVEWSSPSILTTFVLLICLILVLILPFMIYDAVNSFRKAAPLARNVGDVVSAVMLSLILFCVFCVVTPTELEFGSRCVDVTLFEVSKCEGLRTKLLSVHVIMLCMQIVLPINDIIKFKANESFAALEAESEDENNAIGYGSHTLLQDRSQTSQESRKEHSRQLKQTP